MRALPIICKRTRIVARGCCRSRRREQKIADESRIWPPCAVAGDEGGVRVERVRGRRQELPFSELPMLVMMVQ